MNIKNFKPGDIINRSQFSRCGDRSYMLSKMELIGVGSGIIFLLNLETFNAGQVVKLPVQDYEEGWEIYPQELESKAVSRSKEMFPEKWAEKENVKSDGGCDCVNNMSACNSLRAMPRG